MKGKLIRTTIAAGLACILTAGYSGSFASAETPSQLQDKLNGVLQKQGQNQNVMDSSKKQLSDNNQQQNSVVGKLNESARKIDAMNGWIIAKQTEVGRNQKDMNQLKSEIDRIIKRIDDRNNLLKGRIRSMYVNGGAVNYLDVLLGSKSFGNFLDRLLVLKMITDQDSKIINDQKKDQMTQVSKQKQLQSKLTKTRQDLASLQVLNASLSQEKRNQQGLLAQLKSDASKLNQTVMSKNEEAGILQAQASVIKNQLASLAKAEAAAIQQKSTSRVPSQSVSAGSTSAQSSGPTATSAPAASTAPAAKTVSADFIMPTTGVISSGFGYRTFDHSFHSGIDIANRIGTPVRAAANGVVSYAAQSSSYGNWVMISHSIGGQLYTTVYAHLTSYNVSEGQSVAQGQIIGAMGQTGEAFGSHLHFELYVGSWTPPPHNGSVNPLNYIK